MYIAATSWMLTSDSWGGFRQSTYNSSVYYAVSTSNTWDKTKPSIALVDITGLPQKRGGIHSVTIIAVRHTCTSAIVDGLDIHMEVSGDSVSDSETP